MNLFGKECSPCFASAVGAMLAVAGPAQSGRYWDEREVQ